MSDWVPDYLEQPSNEGYKYGNVEYDEGIDSFVIQGEPAMLEMAKRMFPGSQIVDRGSIRFKATRRAGGDLNWFLLRFPVEFQKGAWEKLLEVRDGAIEHARRREDNTNLNPVVPPAEFTAELLPFQKEGVAYLVANKRALLGDGTGLGKTFTTLGAVAAAKAMPALIVVQAHLQKQWQRVIGSLFNLPGEVQLSMEDTEWSMSKKKGEVFCHICKGLTPYELPDVPFVICHYGLLRGWRDTLNERCFKAVVFDEVQELRHTGSKKYSVASELSSDAEYVWGLSGTPIFGYGIEMWCVMNAIDYHCLSDREAFTREWCRGYGDKIVEKPKVLGDYLRREGLMLRRRIYEVQSELPPVRRIVQDVDKDDDLYNQLASEAISLAHKYDKIGGWGGRGKAALRIESDSRRATGVAKAPYVASFVSTMMEGGEIPLIFAWHHDVHDRLMEVLGPKGVVKVTGKETVKQKEAALEKFMSGDASGMLLSLRSAAGLDGLQMRATCCIFAELDWAPAVHSQAEARIQRMGVNKALEEVMSYYCVTDTGMDEVIQEALGLKTQQFVMMMDDEIETEDERALARQAAEGRIKKLIDVLKKEKLTSGETNLSSSGG